MLIVCPHCSTNYDLAPSTLGAAGRTVRCARCHETWFARATLEPAVATAQTVEAGLRAPAMAATALGAQRVTDPAPGEPHRSDAAPAPAKGAANAAPAAKADADEFWGMPDFPAPPIAPTTVDATAEPLPGNGTDIESEAARRASGTKRHVRRRGGRLSLPTIPAIIAVELAAIIAILTWRTEIVRAMPQTASLFRNLGLPVNLRGLTFGDVRSSTDAHDGITVLMVEGNIVNATHATVGVPRLRFALRNAAGAEVISWTAQPDKGSLAPDETLAFRSRLASPPADGNDIVVRFLTRQDITNGTR